MDSTSPIELTRALPDGSPYREVTVPKRPQMWTQFLAVMADDAGIHVTMRIVAEGKTLAIVDAVIPEAVMTDGTRLKQWLAEQCRKAWAQKVAADLVGQQYLT